ncbi:hypothetical protein C8F01DRAFT_1264308 [Mycena amicta]|nr:hypothetical protein C8F01DRAFT_1264308 [Mycena amicta]
MPPDYSFVTNGSGDDTELELISMGAKSPRFDAGSPSNTANFSNETPRRGVLHFPGSSPTDNNGTQLEGPFTQFMNMTTPPSWVFDTPTQPRAPETPRAPVKQYQFSQIVNDRGHPLPPIDYASRSFQFSGTPEGNPTPHFTLQINHNEASATSSDDLPFNPSPLAEMLREQYRAQHMAGYMATVAAGRAAASVGKKTKQQRVKMEEGVLGAGKENTGDLVVIAKAARVEWNATRYLKAARIVNVQQPWLAPHGKKAGAWDECAALFNNQNSLSVSGHLFHMKMEGIIGWKKNPNGKFKALGSVIASGTGDAIMLGAQMEAMETQFDQAKDKSDDAKVKIQQKNDEDKSGGDEIRRASMQALRKRAISISSDETDTDTDTDTVPADKAAVPADKATVPADTDTASTDEGTISTGAPAPIDITTDDDENKDTVETKRKASKKPKSKRRRVMERGSTSDELIDIFKAENQRRAAHDERIATSWEAFVSDAREGRNLLKQLVFGKEGKEGSDEE